MSGITDEYTIKVTGNISQNTLQTLADKIKTAKTSINLDLSEATGLVAIGATSDSKSIFADCPLNKVVLPKTLEIIGSYAFYSCTIKCVIIPTSIQTIGNWAFWKCSNLEAVEINGAETVGNYAFYNCKNLRTITLKNVKTLGTYAFAYCTNLLSITMEAIGSIDSYAFEDCESLSSVSINAESIGTRVFYNCTSLTAVTIGKNVKSINNTYACFDGCTLLTSVRFEDTEGWYCKSSSGYSFQKDVTNAAENASNFKYYNYLWYKK